MPSRARHAVHPVLPALGFNASLLSAPARPSGGGETIEGGRDASDRPLWVRTNHVWVSAGVELAATRVLRFALESKLSALGGAKHMQPTLDLLSRHDGAVERRRLRESVGGAAYAGVPFHDTRDLLPPSQEAIQRLRALEWELVRAALGWVGALEHDVLLWRRDAAERVLHQGGGRGEARAVGEALDDEEVSELVASAELGSTLLDGVRAPVQDAGRGG